MAKYILLALVAIAGMLVAQDIEANSSLDQPVKFGTSPAISMRVVGAYFDGWNIKRIVDFLVNLPTSSQSRSQFWTDASDPSSLKTELTAYYNNFPQSSEVFTATMSNGYTSYYDWYGHTIQTTTGTNQDLEDKLAVNGQFVSSGLLFYAGRNTLADNNPKGELQITTNNGSKYTIYAYDTTTPLVLDMDGDNVLEASRGQWLPHAASRNETKWTEFDINGDGFDELIEWVGPNDGILLTYKPGEKVTGRNFFGNAKGFSEGYEQLSTLDTNNDSKISDGELATLSVWQDKNSNARVDSGEVSSVVSLGITEISTNETEMVSYFQRDGKTYMMWDWYPTTLMVKKNRF